MERADAPKDELQPTVRVMRLYRPNLHGIHQFSSYSKCDDGTTGVVGSIPSDFAISPYILFPDSFGDIYCGETFSAYIAVVNGSNDVAFQLVKLSIRLQTSSSSYDLHGSDPGSNNYPVHVGPLNHVNAIVRHDLLELGSYTLRVQVEYMLNTSNEVKTIRKFYKFNVNQPMMVKKSYDYLLEGSRIMAQSTVTNMTKAPLFIENISISDINFNNNNCSNVKSNVVSAGNSGAVDGDSALKLLQVTSDVLNYSTPLQHYPFDSAPILGPNESHAYGVTLSNIDTLLNQDTNLGGTEQVLSWQDNIRWYSYMSESGVVRETNSSSVLSAHIPKSLSSNKPIIAVTAVNGPADTTVGKEFDIVIRIYNLTASEQSIQLDANNRSHSSSGATADSLDSAESLHVVGTTCFEIPVISGGSYHDIKLSLCAMRSGLNELKEVLFTDKSTKKEYRSGVIFRLFVYT